jgi:hypothetical protein
LRVTHDEHVTSLILNVSETEISGSVATAL